jgi:hypothetical protein
MEQQAGGKFKLTQTLKGNLHTSATFQENIKAGSDICMTAASVMPVL